jgi:hypothetical protein
MRPGHSRTEQAHELAVSKYMRERGLLDSDIDGEIMITLYVVVSDIDKNMHGPFVSRDDALAIAEAADGSLFKCTARLINVEEV